MFIWYNSFFLNSFLSSTWSIKVMHQFAIPSRPSENVHETIFFNSLFFNFLNNSFVQFPSKLTMRAFIVVKSKSKLCNCTTYIRELKLTFFAFKKIYHIVVITIQRAFKNVKSFFWLYFLKFCSIFNWLAYFT